MSQTVAGDDEGAGWAPQPPSHKHFQQTTQGSASRFACNPIPQEQNGLYCRAVLPSYASKPLAPNMANGFRPPMQIPPNMQVGPMPYHTHYHPHHQSNQLDQMNVMAINHESHKVTPNQNPCGNIQYVPGGNYVATVTVQPRDQYQQQHSFNQPNNQLMSNQHKYVMNPAMLNTMNNVNYMPNMVVSGYKNYPFSINTFPQNSTNADNLQYIPSPSTVSSGPKSGESNDTSFDESEMVKDVFKISEAHNSTDLSSTSEPSPSQLSTSSIKSNNSPNANSPISRNSSRNSMIHNPNRPRTISCNDPDRSETSESSCSSLSTESASDPSQAHSHSNPIYNDVNNVQFVNNPIHNNHLNSTNVNCATYSDFQQGANFGQAKMPLAQQCNQNLVQGFNNVNSVHHMRMQNSHVQVMQQPYRYIQGQSAPMAPRIRPNMGILSNCNIQSNGFQVVNSSVIPNHNLPNLDKSTNANSPVQDNCNKPLSNNPYNQFAMQQQQQAQLLYPSMVGGGNQMQLLSPSHMIAGMANPTFVPSSCASMQLEHTRSSEIKDSFPPLVVVPFGWRRIIESGHIVYISPSGKELRSSPEVTEYLTQEGTCKCGLQCPLRVEETFCFDAKVPHRLTMPNELSSAEMTKFCSHLKKLSSAFSDHLKKQAKKEDGRKKRKRKLPPEPSSNAGNSFPQPFPGENSTSISQLQAQPFVCHVQQRQHVQQLHMQQNFGDANSMPPQQQQQHHPHLPTRHVQSFQAGSNHQQGTSPHLPQMVPSHNWPQMGGMPRMMMPPGCLPVNYQQMCNQQYNGQHPCCDNHACFSGIHGMLPHCGNHGAQTKSFGGPEGPPQQFCHSSAPGEPMFRPMQGPSEPNSINRQTMNHVQQQQVINNPTMIGSVIQPAQPYLGGNPVCQMRCPHTTMNEQHPNMPPTGSPLAPEVPNAIKGIGSSKESEKRRRNTGRGKKRTKVAAIDSPAPSSVTSTPNSNAVSEPPLMNRCSSEGPSFMEDPNGYLAQQTALLNNTMAGGGVGQFSPQAPRASPRSSISHSSTLVNSSPLSSSKNPVTSGPPPTLSSRASSSSHASATIVPLPSNVPLPARVSKASSLPTACSIECSATTLTTTHYTATCSSVHSKSVYSTSLTSSTIMSSTPKRLKLDPISIKNDENLAISTENASDLLTLSSSCKSRTNSPHSSEASSNSASPPTSLIKDIMRHSYHKSSKTHNSSSNSEKLQILQGKPGSTSNLCSKDDDALSLEAAANKPLTPGPADATMNTQSPLEMVQNIVSSIPVPSSDSPPVHNNRSASQQGPPQSLLSDHIQQGVSQQVINPHVFNMAGAGNMTGVVYNPGSSGSNLLRGPAPLVVHGTGSSVTLPSGVLVNSSSNNMVVATSPFTTKGSVTTPVVCSNITGVVGVQAVPHVQMQPPIGSVQPQQIQPQLQQIQPVVQLVNTFAPMQGPVIIQNGGNLIQSSSGLISNQSGVIGATGIIPSSGPTFVANQSLIPTATLAVDSSLGSSHLSVAQVVNSESSEVSDDSHSANRSTPIATSALTPTTPLNTSGSSHGADTPPHSSVSSGGSGSGGKRKRKRRNASTPQNIQQPTSHSAGIVPTFIMGKQIQQPVVMNSSQLSPYGNVSGTHITTVAAVGNSPGSAQGGQVLQPAPPSQSANAINVVQMVAGTMAGPLPVQLQQAPTLLIPSAAPSGLIINQLPDGTFFSTDPNTGVSYPVQFQLSGSHTVGISPSSNSNQPTGMIGSIATPSNNTAPLVTLNSVRTPGSQPNAIISPVAKVINISPTSSGSNYLYDTVFDSSKNHDVQNASVPPQNVPNGTSQFSQQNSIAAGLQRPILVSNANATVVQQKTTIVAQQTTVVAAQSGLMGTHSSVSTQTPAGAYGESDVTSSDSAATNPVTDREFSTSPTHQSAEITTTRCDDDSLSSPHSLSSTPTQELLPSMKGQICVSASFSSQINSRVSEEPHSATIPAEASPPPPSGRVVVVWAPHRGFTQWPAQLLHQTGGNVLVRWYGDHTVDTIPLLSISEYRREVQKTPRRRSRGRDALEKAIVEANEDLLLAAQISPQPGSDEGGFTPLEQQDESASPPGAFSCVHSMQVESPSPPDQGEAIYAAATSSPMLSPSVTITQGGASFVPPQPSSQDVEGSTKARRKRRLL